MLPSLALDDRDGLLLRFCCDDREHADRFLFVIHWTEANDNLYGRAMLCWRLCLRLHACCLRPFAVNVDLRQYVERVVKGPTGYVATQRSNNLQTVVLCFKPRSALADGSVGCGSVRIHHARYWHRSRGSSRTRSRARARAERGANGNFWCRESSNVIRRSILRLSELN